METFLDLIRPIITKDLIRIGKKNDGGYVINSKVISNVKLISLGINTDWSFEKDFLKYSSNKIFMYDGSISNKKFLKNFTNKLFETFSLNFILAIWEKDRLITHLRKIRSTWFLYSSFKKFTSRKNIL